MFRNALLIYIMLLLGFSQVAAQISFATLYGSVKDQQGDPLFTAQVYYVVNGRAIGTNTDERGGLR